MRGYCGQRRGFSTPGPPEDIFEKKKGRRSSRFRARGMSLLSIKRRIRWQVLFVQAA
jgi:hypothetical protein